MLPILEDNYVYILSRERSEKCIVIDPGDSSLVIDFCYKNQLTPSQIWLTHWHKDHTQGVKSLLEIFKCEVLGPKKEVEKIPEITQSLSEFDLFHFGPHKVKILETPGHTLGHIVYWLYEDDLLFSGDTLFSLGCGRLFEGSAHEMWMSLCKLRSLPAQTQIYPGHEYSLENARFALEVDPENANLKLKQKKIDDLRSKGLPSIPSTLEEEILSNPFLRVDLPYWKNQFNMPTSSPSEIFAHLRTLKDQFS